MRKKKTVKNKERKTKKINMRYVYWLLGSSFLVLLALVIIMKTRNIDEKYLVQDGTIEETELAKSYVVKDEVVKQIDTSKILIPVISEGYRVAKGDIVATYKGTEYENYTKTLEEMDKEILILMKDLPPVYSSEIDAIDANIYKYLFQASKETSYIKMQEYKTIINNLIGKRAEIIGKLSPDGAAIKQLIKNRNEYEVNAKKSSNNILAKISGIVSYKTDDLEETIKLSKIDDLLIKDLNNYCKNIKTSNSKIKIVNNYLAYFVVQVTNKNKDYMTIGKTYKIRLSGDSFYEYNASLYKITENDSRL